MNSKDKIFIVADDDACICTLLKVCLEQNGWRVLPARNGREALELVKAYGDGGLELLITDVDMPVMDGFELCRRVREERPQTRILVMSGKSDIPGLPFLEKPFRPDDLYRAVRMALLLPPMVGMLTFAASNAA